MLNQLGFASGTIAARWVAAGLLISGLGCATSPERTTEAPSPSVSPADVEARRSSGPLEVGDLPKSEAHAAINVFGELDGVENTSFSPRGDAGFQQHTFTDDGGDTDVSVDPTGKWLAFASTRNSEHAEICLQRVDGTAVIQLTNDNTNAAYPTFSPDGKQIAFSSTRGGTWQIYIMDTDGRNTVQITSGAMQAVHPSFSPDGTRLVYAGLGPKSHQWELWSVQLQSGEKRMIGYGLFPTWCPDKSVDRIAFQRARQRGSRWFSLWTLDLVNGEARRPTEVIVSSAAAVLSPAWSPDGKHLAFATVLQPARTEPGKNKGQTDIWMADVDGSNRRRLTDGAGTNLTPCWAVDQRIYFISDRSGAECVWSVRPELGATLVEAKEAKEPKEAKPTAVSETDADEATR